jgi:hypothetical protein
MTPEQFRSRLSISSTLPVVTYAPDPISLRFPIERFSFNELTILGALLRILNKFQSFTLLIKLHPLQPMKEIMEILSGVDNPRCKLLTQDEINNLELVNHSSVVVGFFSNFLSEAILLNRPVIRYCGLIDDEFTPIFTECATSCRNLAELENEIELCCGSGVDVRELSIDSSRIRN